MKCAALLLGALLGANAAQGEEPESITLSW